MCTVIITSSEEGFETPGEWSIPHNRHWFDMNTENSIILMGYNTYFALNKTPFPNRVNVILWNGPYMRTDSNVYFVPNFQSMLDNLDPKPIFVIGGAQTIASLSPYITRWIITQVYGHGGAKRPELDLDNVWESPEWIHGSRRYRFGIYRKCV